MSPEQAEAVADALTLEQRVARAALDEKRVVAERRRKLQNRTGGLGLFGMAIGCLVGYAFFDRWLLGAFVGLGVGGLAGRWSFSRRA